MRSGDFTASVLGQLEYANDTNEANPTEGNRPEIGHPTNEPDTLVPSSPRADRGRPRDR